MALLVAATVAVYARVATFEFINLDDPPYVTENSHVLSGLTRDGIVWAFTTTTEANWHPLTWLSLQLDAEAYGPSARGFHTSNIVLHVGAVLLLFLLFERMTESVWRSALVAALFALHPLHVESVAWVAERKDVLSAVLGLLACHAWLCAIERPGVGRRALALTAYAASLLAKPMLVSLPILLLLFDVWPLKRTEPCRRLIVEKIPMFALSAASCVVTFLVQAHGGATRTTTQYPLVARTANAAVAYVTYLARAIWPSGLAVYQPYPYEGIPAWKTFGALLILGAATAACVRVRRRSPQFLVGWIWYLVALVPVIGLLQVGSQATADRYTYLPLIGPFFMVAFGLPDLARSKTAERRGSAWALGTVVIAGVAVLGFFAWRQAGYWSDSVTLFTRAIAVTKDNAVAHNALARALFDRGEIDLAVEHCAEAVRIAPEMGAAQANLVRGLLAQRKIPEAAARTEEALRRRPNDSRTHVNAGLVARYQGRDDDAIRSFEKALLLDPADEEAHLNLGATLAAHGRRDEAVAQFEEAVRLRPGDLRARNALAHLLGTP